MATTTRLPATVAPNGDRSALGIRDDNIRVVAPGAVEAKKGILLDIGCGASKQPGFVGMDHQALDGVDVVHSWDDFPWPFAAESVLTIVASHVVEHVSPINGHFLRWMDECWRVLKPGRQLALVTPYAGSPGYWWDPTHCNGCTEMTWAYFDPCHASGFHRFYRPKPWKIEVNTYHREGNLEVVLRKRPVIEPCGHSSDAEHSEPCPRPFGHPGDHYDFYQTSPGANGAPVRVVVTREGHVKAEWNVPAPLALEDVAYRLAEGKL